MKKYLLLFSLFLLGISANTYAQDDAIERYFDQYVDDERFTVVYISSKMFQLISKLDLDEVSEDKEAKVALEVIEDLRGLRILTTDILTNQFYKEAIKKIDTNDYEVLMKVRDGEENIHFWVKEDASGDIINELLLLVGGEEDFVLLSFIGNIDLDKISKLAKTIDVNGVEHLEKL